MPRIFTPLTYCKVPTSKMHVDTAKYYVAIGMEQWEESGGNLVIKVMMEYDGKLTGRMAPSYPITQSDIYSEDWERVCEAVEAVKKAYKNGEHGEITLKKD